MKRLTSDELAEFLFANKYHNCVIDFYEESGNDYQASYQATTTAFADAPMVIINRFGGGSLFACDLSEFDNLATLKMALQAYFKNYAIDTILVVEKQFNKYYRGWVSVEDRLPDPYQSVWVRGGAVGGSSGTPAHWDGEIWRLDTEAPLIGVAQWRLP